MICRSRFYEEPTRSSTTTFRQRCSPRVRQRVSAPPIRMTPTFDGVITTSDALDTMSRRTSPRIGSVFPVSRGACSRIRCPQSPRHGAEVSLQSSSKRHRKRFGVDPMFFEAPSEALRKTSHLLGSTNGTGTRASTAPRCAIEDAELRARFWTRRFWSALLCASPRRELPRHWIRVNRNSQRLDPRDPQVMRD